MEKVEARKTSATDIATGLVVKGDGVKQFFQEESDLRRATEKAETFFIEKTKSFGFPKDFPQGKWNNLDEKRVKIQNEGIDLIKSVRNSNTDSPIPLKTAMVSILKIAKNLLLTRVMDQQVSLTKAYGVIDHHQPLDQSLRFKTYGEASVKIEGFSITDFLRKKKNFTFSQYLRSAVEATLTINEYSKDKYDKIVSGNTDNSMLMQYPNVGAQAIYNACEQISMFSVITPDIFDDVKVPCSNETGQEIISQAREVIEQASAIRKGLFETVFSPNSPDFPALKQVLEEYLDSENPDMRTQTLMKFGLSDPRIMMRMYRTAKKMQNSYEQHKDFYAKLIGSLEKFSREYLPEDRVFPFDELKKFLPDSNCEGKKIPSFEDLRKINEQILKRSLDLKAPGVEYEISPISIDFHGTETLKNIKAAFPCKGDPTKVTICLEGKEINFDIAVNAKKNEIYWNSLDDPNEPKMKGIKNEAMLLVNSILLAVQKQVEIEHLERQKAKTADIDAPTMISDIRKAPKRTWVPREKDRKIEKPKPTQIHTIMENETPLPPDTTVKKCIFFPRQNYGKLMKGISPEIKARIMRKMAGFNKNGQGEFSALVATHEGKTIYKLRVGDCRILAIQVEPPNGNGHGKQYLEVFKIDTRQKVYGNQTRVNY